MNGVPAVLSVFLFRDWLTSWHLLCLAGHTCSSWIMWSSFSLKVYDIILKNICLYICMVESDRFHSNSECPGVGSECSVHTVHVQNSYSTLWSYFSFILLSQWWDVEKQNTKVNQKTQKSELGGCASYGTLPKRMDPFLTPRSQNTRWTT